MSFAFIVAEEGEEWEEGKRTITEFDEVFDVSPVTYPAYPQTSVKVRMSDCDINRICQALERKLRQSEELDDQGVPPQEGHVGRLGIQKKRLELIEK
jgi:phage head maturation protease